VEIRAIKKGGHVRVGEIIDLPDSLAKILIERGTFEPKDKKEAKETPKVKAKRVIKK